MPHKTKPHLKIRFDIMIVLLLNDTWQGWQSDNQTFGDELEKVDVQEIHELLDEDGQAL